MPTLKIALCVLILTAALLISESCAAQFSKKDQRAFRERGTDSAWFYNPAFARPRFYLGSTRVSGNEFENALRNSDAEVDALIEGARRKLNTSQYVSLGALACGLSGWLVISANQNNYYNYGSNNKVSTAGIILLGASLALEGVALGFSIEANNRYRNGMRTFNKKAKAGTLQPQLRVGTTTHGLGLALDF